MTKLLSALIVCAAACSASTPSQNFDFAHLEGALAYFAAPDDQTLIAVSKTRAARHLKRHSDRTGYYDPEFTTLEITSDLISPKEPPTAQTLAEVTALLRYAKDNRALQKECIDEADRYLPKADLTPKIIYITWGYDIGVASDLGASLNFAHQHFRNNPGEIWFYCVHELHHVGVIRLHPFPSVSAVENIGAFVELIKYLTFLEGTAVFSALEMREEFDALADDEDYVALQDEARMMVISDRYVELLENLAARDPAELLGESDWAIIDEMSGGERLWYRHGAKMAMRLYETLGSDGFHEVVAAGPEMFFDAYDQIAR